VWVVGSGYGTCHPSARLTAALLQAELPLLRAVRPTRRLDRGGTARCRHAGGGSTPTRSMNEFLPDLFVESIQRLALGIECTDAMLGSRIGWPVEVALDGVPHPLPRHLRPPDANR